MPGMVKHCVALFTVGALAWAVEAPPAIPDGRITYDELSYQSPGQTELPPEFAAEAADHSAPAGGVAPSVPPSSASPHTVVNLTAYATDYQVRGMGVTNDLSEYGTSSVSVSFTPANRNLFHKGIQQRFHGLGGVIWDASCPLGDVLQFELGYSLGKEVLPNLLVELGYTFRRGGLEGYMAKWHDGASHRSAQDVTLRAAYNDFQKGFFGHAEIGAGFYGLTGFYMDFEGGYRYTDVVRPAAFGLDLEVSLGVAPSFSYWGTGVEGLDASRVRVAFLPYSPNGRFGRDARTFIKPWVQVSWTGNNARKITRNLGYTPVDHFQFTLGLDIGWKF